MHDGGVWDSLYFLNKDKQFGNYSWTKINLKVHRTHLKIVLKKLSKLQENMYKKFNKIRTNAKTKWETNQIDYKYYYFLKSSNFWTEGENGWIKIAIESFNRRLDLAEERINKLKEMSFEII